jgi:hypothetical protein
MVAFQSREDKMGFHAKTQSKKEKACSRRAGICGSPLLKRFTQRHKLQNKTSLRANVLL